VATGFVLSSRSGLVWEQFFIPGGAQMDMGNFAGITK